MDERVALLEVRGVTIQFGGVRALDAVDLEVANGQIAGLIGPNGAGKTTLFNAISGIVRPDTGRVLFRGQDITGMSPQERCHAGIARTFQLVQPFSRLSVADNVAVARIFGKAGRAHAPTRKQASAQARDLLAFGKLTAKADWPAASLTLSERKRLEMVRALATDPALLLLDEVLAGLNPREADEMTAIVRDLQRQFGLAVLMVEHNVQAVLALSETVTVLNFGTVIARGDAATVMGDEAVVTAYVGEKATSAQVQRPTAAQAPVSPPMLEVQDLSVAYGDLQVLWDVGFAVRPGELVALIGPNGAGKSTTLKALAGLVPTRAGDIRFEGLSIRDQPSYTRIRHGISFVPEGRRLFMTMSVQENLEMGGAAVRPAGGIQRQIERVFTLFPILGEKRRQSAGTLSGGQQQMLAIGMGLISQPKLLILDEPSLGLAPIMVGHLYQSIANLRRDGLTIILVEQQIFLALDMADRTYVLETGRIRLEGGRDELMASAHIQEHYFGSAAHASLPH